MADQTSEGLLSPLLRNLRIREAKRFLNGRVLDVGCGGGALANLVDTSNYLGIEIDPESLANCKAAYPGHSFSTELPDHIEKFDTIVSLAVIEHVDKPHEFLQQLALSLEGTDSARILLSTPHPAMDWIHTAGAYLGLFSRHASDEHEELLDHAALASLGSQAGLELLEYRRFMLGANQLAVYRRSRTH